MVFKLILTMIVLFDSEVLSTEECPSPRVKNHPNLGWSPKKLNHQIGEEIRWKCDSGYILTGNETSVCREDGEFTQRPKCTAKTCPRPTVDHLTAKPLKQIYEFKDIVEWGCPTGYKLVGKNRTMCDMDNEFIDVPYCEVRCPPPVVRDQPNLIWTPNSREYKEGAVIQWKCPRGYILQGSNTSLCTNGSKFTASPHCQAIQCQRPNITNQIINPHQLTYQFKTNITWSCPDTYSLQGKNVSTCSWMGNFSSIPICKVSHCMKPTISWLHIVNTKIRYKFGDMIYYYCKKTNLTLDGPSVSVCMKNGSFTRISKCNISKSIYEPQLPVNNTKQLKKIADLEAQLSNYQKYLIAIWILFAILMLAMIGIVIVICYFIIHKYPKKRKSEDNIQNKGNCDDVLQSLTLT